MREEKRIRRLERVEESTKRRKMGKGMERLKCRDSQHIKDGRREWNEVKGREWRRLCEREEDDEMEWGRQRS